MKHVVVRICNYLSVVRLHGIESLLELLHGRRQNNI